MFDETADCHAPSLEEVFIDKEKDLALDTVECPYCKGLFGVDWTYLEQVDNVVHCPMCCMQVIFEDWEDKQQKVARCNGCSQPFTKTEWEERHWFEGEEYHERCCPLCNGEIGKTHETSL
jgi:hypothetical protein